ncbi:hypothetical protein HDV00_006464 [Rhizophlyctis rosea]|nr:hypothetical protein HDV00_006464 [Rhizophlyctis rosea]
MTLHFDIRGNPAVELNYHCRYPTNKWSGYPAPEAKYGFESLNCGGVGADVKVCQGLGKKVLISISPSDYLLSPDNATLSATNVFNTFLGGSTTYRPFGDAVLDGVDLHIWNNDVNGYYTPFVTKLRQLMSGDSARTYYLSATPRCDFPDVTFGPAPYAPTAPLTATPNTFDYITPFFTASPNICGWGVNNAGFWSTLQKWTSWSSSLPTSIPILVGLPSWYDPSWAQAAVGDYIDPVEIYNKSVVPQMKGYTGFAGVAMGDGSFDYINHPCSDSAYRTPRRYSQIWWEQLTVSVEQAGANSPAGQKCVEVDQRVVGGSGTGTSGSGTTGTTGTGGTPSGNDSSCAFYGTCGGGGGKGYQNASRKGAGAGGVWVAVVAIGVGALFKLLVF